jgi:hypothetical protein
MNLKSLFRRSNKYKAQKTTVNGITFDSKKEANRYQELLLLEKSGKISELKLQPKFILQEPFLYDSKQYSSIAYTADFTYHDNDLQKEVVEEVKGFRTYDYTMRKKLFLKKYGNAITFIEI